jgi:hypothetical protein
MVSQIKVNEIIKQSGSSISIGESGDTINLAGATYTVAANTPAFLAYNSSSTQSIAQATNTLLQFNTEQFDIGSCYDTSTYKWTPNVAGKYYVYHQWYKVVSESKKIFSRATIRMNDSQSPFLPEMEAADLTSFNNQAGFISYVFDMNGSSDYLQCYNYHYDYTDGAAYNISNIVSGERLRTYFGGFFLIGA